MFNSRTEAVDKLSEAILSNNINDTIWNEAKAKAEKMKVEEEERTQEKKEKRRIWEIEQNRPPVKYPKLYNLRYMGQIYVDELIEYCQNHDLAALKNYLADFLAGRWQGDDFKNGTAYQAYTFLLDQVQTREQKSQEG